MYDVLCRTAIFGVRNADKVISTSDKGRAAADIGQFTKAIRVASELDNSLGKGAQAAINVVGKASTQYKALEYAAKGAKWASNNVNPLLIGAAGYRVLAAEDKSTQMKREVFGMTGMFAAEGLAKEIFASGKMAKFRNGVGNKYVKIGLQILEGVLFVGASIAGSGAGYAIGKKCFAEKVKKDDASVEKESITNKTPEPAVKEVAKAAPIDEYEEEMLKPLSEKKVLA